ncbi:MAG: cyclic nucleotide-binding domain-containing protein, partial [bacterium]
AFTNLLPVIVLFGVMGYFAIPLNIGTTMAAAIAIGIAVDDTMHFMLRYNRELRESKQQNKAMVTTIHGEMLPIISTSAALVLGFMVFAFSDFEPVAQFGMLSALVIATALFTDLVLTPIAISSLRLVTIWDLLSFQLREEIIGKSALFKGLRKWEIRKFVLASNLVSFDAGRQVFVQGDPSEEMYMVMTGSVEVNVTDASGDKVFTELILPGETFGEVAMLAAEPRKTNALALENSSLLLLTRESIENTTRLNRLVSAKVFKNMAKDISRRHVRYLGIHSRINREDD